jgi:membrane peptidoglycan carboxypeptidase
LRQKLDASRSLGVTQGAVVVLDQTTGGILAIAGGRDYRQSQFNRASMALRQPGSAFKLVPYLLAIERGAKPSDAISCAPLRWQGQMFDSGCGGTISLRQALAISSNTAALRLGRRVGLEAVAQKARDLGITTPLQPVPGLVLGQSEVTLLQLTSAYLAVANDGLWHALYMLGIKGRRACSWTASGRSTSGPIREFAKVARCPLSYSLSLSSRWCAASSRPAWASSWTPS